MQKGISKIRLFSLSFVFGLFAFCSFGDKDLVILGCPCAPYIPRIISNFL